MFRNWCRCGSVCFRLPQAQAAKDAAAQKAGETRDWAASKAQGATDTAHSYAQAAQQNVGSAMQQPSAGGMGTVGTSGGVGTPGATDASGTTIYKQTTTTTFPSGAVGTAPAVPVVGVNPPFQQHTTATSQQVRRRPTGARQAGEMRRTALHLLLLAWHPPARASPARAFLLRSAARGRGGTTEPTPAAPHPAPVGQVAALLGPLKR